MKTLILITVLIGSCSMPHEYTLKTGEKFLDGEVRHGRLRIQTRPANNEPAEIILFQDGSGNDFTIYEN